MINIAAYLRYVWLLHKTRPRRYRVLFETIYRQKSLCLVEIGVFDGKHALEMIRTASVHHAVSKIEYFGFNLFEELTDELLEQENSKKPLPYAVIQQKLEQSGAKIRLFKGNTKQTLPASLDAIRYADFIFIDGGHSIETIRSDWSYLQTIMTADTVVIFDDYYENTAKEAAEAGCQSLIDQLDRRQYDARILEPLDRFEKAWGTLKVRMVSVKKAR